MRSLTIGVVAGLSIALPLYGAVGGIPSSAIAAVLVATSCLFLLPSIVSVRLRWDRAAVPIAAGGVFAIFVLLSAYETQWEFLMTPGFWRHNASRYFHAKLFMFLLSFGTGTGACVLILSAADKAKMVKGVCLGIAAVSALGAARLMINHGHQLWAQDYETARTFFVGSRGFSTVNYGILMMLGAICSLRFRWGWIAAALFLTGAVLLARRADSGLIVLSVVGLYGWLIVRRREPSLMKRLAGFAAMATLLVSISINDLSSEYFSNFAKSVADRYNLLSASTGDGVDPSRFAYFGEADIQDRTGIPDGIESGLGYFSTGVLGKFNYPHNIMVEIYGEVGIAGMIAFAIIVLCPIFLALRHIKALEKNALLSLLLMGAMLGIALKAGDMNNAGKIVFFATLAAISVVSSILNDEVRCGVS